MADATTIAPIKKEKKEVTILGEKVTEGSREYLALTQEFDPDKKYMFQAADENMTRELPIYEIQGTRSIPMPHKKFKPYQNVVLTSQIIWGGTRRMVRYYSGCDSLFVDKQPKEKELIEQFIKQTEPVRLLEGKFGFYGVEKMLLIYLNICSWNGRSPFRTRSATTIFVPVNADEMVSLEVSKLDEIDEARNLAKTASEQKMLIHSAYLGIPTKDYDSGNELKPEEIRVEYRKAAIRDSKGFIESYGNKKIELKYYIDKALREGNITNKQNPNKAAWANGTEITDISGLKTHEGIADRLFEFSQLSEGEEFLIQLKALYEG